jgi:hypothetical protein
MWGAAMLVEMRNQSVQMMMMVQFTACVTDYGLNTFRTTIVTAIEKNVHSRTAVGD